MKFIYALRKPLQIIRFICAVVLAVGCFLGFPNDAALSGIFWLITAVMLGLNFLPIYRSWKPMQVYNRGNRK